MRKEKLLEFGARIESRMALLSKSAHQVAAETGASYEMARRYARGIAMPTSPEAMQRLAKALECSVGYLFAKESISHHALRDSSELTKPIREACRFIVQDNAMALTADRFKLLGLGDEITIYPRRALPGDLVALRVDNQITLRKAVDRHDGLHFEPRSDSYRAIAASAAKVIGVVAAAQAKFEGY